ncbi:MAG: hypothetical protein Q9184_004341 [Pyrenodesmia sp. 2 TL-2023]
MDVDEDGGYSDDDLDALPVDTFHKLQHHAIISTQQATGTGHPPVLPAYKPHKGVSGALSGGLKRLSVTGRRPSLQDELDNPQHPSSDYGELDDEMLDGEIYDAAEGPGIDPVQASRAANIAYGVNTQRELWREQRHGAPSVSTNSALSRMQVAPPLSNGNDGSLSETREPKGLANTVSASISNLQPDINDLQTQILELRRERDELAKAKQAAEDAALAKAGEIAIVRANQTKTEKMYESKLQTLQKLRQDEAARQRLEVEQALAEKQKIVIEKGFLQNDIVEGNQQIKDLQRAVKAKQAASRAARVDNTEETTLPTTPTRNKSVKHADGFNTDEIRPPMPYRSKNNTPRAGSKRKRKAVKASPVKPLQLSQAHGNPEPVDINDSPAQQSYMDSVTVLEAPPAAAADPLVTPSDERFMLSQHVMNHRMDLGGKRTFEALSEYAYPSKPDRALSAVFLDKMSPLTTRRNIDNFPVAVAQVVIAMWQQCVDEQFWQPARLLLDLTRYILCITPVTIAPLLVVTLVQVIQSTADVIVLPRIRRQPCKFSAEVNTFDCIELLKTIAIDCSAHDEDTIQFWKCMRFDFVAMILNVVQPLNELHVTLDLLRRSVLKETFAMIVPPNDGKQEPSELNLIDLLSRLLVETLKPLKDENPYDTVDIAKLRLSVLSLIEEMCENKHSSQALASSQHVIGRLVWVMNDELDALYNHQYGYKERAELVNQATRIVFRLRTEHPQLINMQEKLKIIPGSGGVHKHLIALTRLALSEGVFFEEEIEDDVVECAYEMLEDLSSPEEAEALREAFSTARSR